MPKNTKLMWGCAALAVLVLVLAVTTGAYFLLFLIPCALMMGAMMWMMMPGWQRLAQRPQETLNSRAANPSRSCRRHDGSRRPVKATSARSTTALRTGTTTFREL